MSTNELKKCPQCGEQNQSEAEENVYTEAIAHRAWCPNHPLTRAIEILARLQLVGLINGEEEPENIKNIFEELDWAKDRINML